MTDVVEQVTGKMLELIDGTHWNQGSLACPVFPKKRMRVPDFAKPSGFGYVMVVDASKPPIKTTYCLVGLVIKALNLPVEGEHVVGKDGEELDGDYGGFDEYGAAKQRPEEFAAVIEALAIELNKFDFSTSTGWSDLLDQQRRTRAAVGDLETWNDGDDTTKEKVRDLIARTHEVAKNVSVA